MKPVTVFGEAIMTKSEETTTEKTVVLPTKKQVYVTAASVAVTVATGVLANVLTAKISDRILNHNKTETE